MTGKDNAPVAKPKYAFGVTNTLTPFQQQGVASHDDAATELKAAAEKDASSNVALGEGLQKTPNKDSIAYRVRQRLETQHSKRAVAERIQKSHEAMKDSILDAAINHIRQQYEDEVREQVYAECEPTVGSWQNLVEGMLRKEMRAEVEKGMIAEAHREMEEWGSAKWQKLRAEMETEREKVKAEKRAKMAEEIKAQLYEEYGKMYEVEKAKMEQEVRAELRQKAIEELKKELAHPVRKQMRKKLAEVYTKTMAQADSDTESENENGNGKQGSTIAGAAVVTNVEDASERANSEPRTDPPQLHKSGLLQGRSHDGQPKTSLGPSQIHDADELVDYDELMNRQAKANEEASRTKHGLPHQVQPSVSSRAESLKGLEPPARVIDLEENYDDDSSDDAGNERAMPTGNTENSSVNRSRHWDTVLAPQLDTGSSPAINKRRAPPSAESFFGRDSFQVDTIGDPSLKPSKKRNANQLDTDDSSDTDSEGPSNQRKRVRWTPSATASHVIGHAPHETVSGPATPRFRHRGQELMSDILDTEAEDLESSVSRPLSSPTSSRDLLNEPATTQRSGRSESPALESPEVKEEDDEEDIDPVLRQALAARDAERSPSESDDEPVFGIGPDGVYGQIGSVGAASSSGEATATQATHVAHHQAQSQDVDQGNTGSVEPRQAPAFQPRRSTRLRTPARR